MSDAAPVPFDDDDGNDDLLPDGGGGSIGGSNADNSALSAAALHCPPTWDGWQCWPEGGSPGRTQYEFCPHYIFFHTNNGRGAISQGSCGSKSRFLIYIL